VLEQADILVAHHGDRFDLPMFQGRLLINGLNPLPKICSIDTLKIARRHFKLNSNKLDYLAKVLGYKGKTENPKGLWKRTFFGEEKALRIMGKYNKNDVDILTYVFEKLMPFIPHKLLKRDILECKNEICDGNMVKKGFLDTNKGRYQRYRCKLCHSWSLGSKIM